ncbi:MAG: hypothetical protein IPI14_10825 [Polaromonas sp.]|nr:hypothetical protein [Polaromonas sp.]
MGCHVIKLIEFIEFIEYIEYIEYIELIDVKKASKLKPFQNKIQRTRFYKVAWQVTRTPTAAVTRRRHRDRRHRNRRRLNDRRHRPP